MAAALALTWSAADANAAFQLDSFTFDTLNGSGEFEAQAGARPHDLITRVQFGTTTDKNGATVPDDNVRTTQVNLPPGFVGNPTATPRCVLSEMYAAGGCPDSTQLGVFFLSTTSNGEFGPFPIYNMVPQSNVPAQFIVQIPLFMNAHVRPDGSITMEVKDASQALTAYGVTIHLWGVPADPSHDNDRGLFGSCFPAGSGFAPCTAGVERRPLLTNTTQCSGQPQVVSLRANSWQHPDQWIEGSVTAPAAITGCDKLVFEPTVDVRPQSHEAAAPSGYEIEVNVPQNEDPDGLATPHVKRAQVTLPEGVSINPATAGGLATCTEAQIGLDNTDEPDCPEASKIGHVTVETPLLDEPMHGAVYQAAQHDNPFGSDFALYLVPEGSGVQLKLPGEVAPDPVTGQLTTTFDDNPQLPFSKLTVSLKGGSRAPLVNPSTCGVKRSQSELVPWSATDPDDPAPDEIVTSTDSFQITEGPNGKPCPSDLADRPFNPEMTSGVINPVAGSFSPFIFRLTRQDGEQEILSTEVTPPEGVTGKLAGIPLCSDEDAEAGTCSADSKVGEVIAGAGAGPTPFYIQGENAGSVYLSGPYKGAPLSLQIQVPAVAGPFDLGMVNVRAAMHVDKRTAQLNVVSDPIPQILEGIPLRVKDLRIRMNRDAFTIAPTNCNEMQVEGTAHGANGAEADLSNRFQVGDCASLGFSPKLNLAYKGKGAKKRNNHPRLAANLNIGGADSVADGDGATQANIRKVRVVLPKGTFLDQGALSRVCTPTQWDAEACPEDSKIGNAKAWSPILDEPLQGPVYLKVGPNELPDIAADLNGIVPIDLYGKIDQSKGRIRNTFQVVPDVPVERFRMNLKGGDGGLLVNSRDICGGKKALRRANVNMAAHNGARLKDKQSVVRCGKKAKRKRGNRKGRS